MYPSWYKYSNPGIWYYTMLLLLVIYCIVYTCVTSLICIVDVAMYQ